MKSSLPDYWLLSCLANKAICRVTNRIKYKEYNMTKIIKHRTLTSIILLAVSIIIPNIASANTQLCFIKEVSADAINWFDANSESEAVVVAGTAHYRFTATSCIEDEFGGINNISLADDLLNIYQSMDDLLLVNGTVEPSVFEYQAVDICVGNEGTIENVASVEGYSMISGDPRFASDNAWIRCDTVIIGGDGCTPGYWKQDQHLDSWAVSTDTLFSEVFGRVITIRQKRSADVTDPTLLQALAALGGQVNTAARHSTAAYLNAVSANVNYDLNVAAIIASFQQSYDSDSYGTLIETMVNFNEQSCPLN